ncbi:MAG: class I SAM-dependent methyltransferase, partial [Clostridia bacterium]|nr:class I SAM-dependent methyltransferase [Clostridia bacterium]
NDSLYMAKLNAKVIAFDIQEDAITSSKKLFDANNISYDNDKVKFILDSHDNIDKYINDNDEIKFATFNLGYLPSGDKSIITKKESTITAIEIILNHLSKDGVLSIICYYDHEGGMDEKIAVDDYLKNIDDKKFEVVKLDKYNDKRNVPISYFVYHR